MSKVIRIGLPNHLINLSTNEIKQALQSNKHKATTNYTTKMVRISEELYEELKKHNITEHTASLLNGFYEQDEVKYHIDQLNRLGYVVDIKEGHNE